MFILLYPLVLQPYVIMKDLQSGREYLWPRTKFINRKFVMQEMFQDYEDGDDWQLPDEKDPFTEDPDAESLIGCVEVSMQSLGYVVSRILKRNGFRMWTNRESKTGDFESSRTLHSENEFCSDFPKIFEVLE